MKPADVDAQAMHAGEVLGMPAVILVAVDIECDPPEVHVGVAVKGAEMPPDVAAGLLEWVAENLRGKRPVMRTRKAVGE